MENNELRIRNKILATQVEKQKRIENDLLFKIVPLEQKQSDDDVMLCSVNRYWKILDENCRLFTKQFDSTSSTQLFDELDKNADSFLIQLSTWDIEELKEKLEKRVRISKENFQNMILALYKLVIRTNALEKLSIAGTGIKIKLHDVKILQQSVKLRRKIITLHRNHYTLNLQVRTKQDTFNIKETQTDELKNRADNLQYQNKKMKNVTDRMEHNLAVILDEIKTKEDSKSETETVMIFASDSSVNYEDNCQQRKVEEEIEKERKLSEQYLQELQVLSIKEQETVKNVETLKIDMRLLPEKTILQTKKYKYLQSKYSILYNEAKQLRQTWDEVQKQMQLLESSFNAAQEASERGCLVQQKNMRQELIKLDDTNGQLRRECQKLKMEMEQSIAENNLFASLNSEMKKLMSSMLDYCKQHESDIKRYKRKYEEIEEDILFSKSMPPMKIKCEKLIQLFRYREIHKRKQREKEAKYRVAMVPMKMPATDGHIKNFHLPFSKESRSKIMLPKHAADRPSKELTPKDLLHTKEPHADIMNSMELLHCKELVSPKTHGKFTYSKEVLRSKEMLKERYLRDCSKMKQIQKSKDVFGERIDEKEHAQKITHKSEEQPDTSKNIGKNIKKEIRKDTATVMSIVNLDSDDSGHDEPKCANVEENKNSAKPKISEEVPEVTCTDDESVDKTADNKSEGSQQDVKKLTQPSKKDLITRKLKYQLKKVMDEKKDLNLLLGMYKNMNKMDEEKVKLLVSEQKLKIELEEVRKQMHRIEETRCDDRKDLVDGVMTRKIKYLLAKRRRLQKKIEDAKDSLLCGEMEITGQVWDELQAQNTRLHQLLRQKDEENLQLMTERVKSNQLYNLSKEENECMMQRVSMNNEKIEMKSEIIQKLEERELAYRNRLTYFEEELVTRKKSCELNRRKAMESAQHSSNLKRQIDKYQKLWKEMQQFKTEKTNIFENGLQKNNALLEEVTQLKRKAERMKKYESAETLDAILTEELREYKNILTCPSCKINTKDAVLIKCFHVYCLNCIKTRYETRQRKCPECCAPFGANDYHRLFLFN